MVPRMPMNSLAKPICLWHLVNSISIIKNLFKSTHMNTHIQKKPENVTLMLSSIFSVVLFLCVFYTLLPAISIISVIRKKRSMLYFKNIRLKGNSVEQKKEHRKGLGAHLASVMHSWVQAEQWASLDLCSCLWKVKMVELVWWNLETAKQRTDSQEIFLKGPFSRGWEKHKWYILFPQP